MSILDSFAFLMSEDDEFAAIRESADYRAVLEQIGQNVDGEVAARAVALIQARPDASPGIVAAVAQDLTLSADDFNYMVDQDTGREEPPSVFDPFDWPLIGANAMTEAGSWLTEQVFKPAVRGTFLVLDGLSQEVQRVIAAGAAGLGASDQNVNFMQAYREYGDSDLRNVLQGDLAEDRIIEVNGNEYFDTRGELDGEGGLTPVERNEEGELSTLGTGWLPGGAARAQSEYDRTLTVNGEALNLGRLFADNTVGMFGADPGERAYDWTAGIAQFAAEVLTDPTAWFTAGTTTAARRAAGTTGRVMAARGLNLTDDAADLSRMKRFWQGTKVLDEEGVTKVTNVYNNLNIEGYAARRRKKMQFTPEMQGEAGVLSNRAADELAEAGEVSHETRVAMEGMVEGINGRSILGQTIKGFFQRDDLLEALVEADTLDVVRAFGQSRARTLDTTAIVALGRANNRDDVLRVLMDQIGKGFIADRGIYGGVTSQFRRWAPQARGFGRVYRRMERLQGVGFSGELNPNNIAESTAKLYTLMKQANIPVESQGKDLPGMLELFEEAALLVDGDAIGLGQVTSKIINRVVKQFAGDKKFADSSLVRDLNRVQSGIVDGMRAYNVGEILEDAGSVYNRVVRVFNPETGGFETIYVGGAHLDSELYKMRIHLPRSEDVRRAAVRNDLASAVVNSGLWDATAGLARYVTQAIFKPAALLRPAYIARTQFDDQLRMAARGYSSIFRTPTEFLQMHWLNKNGEITDLIGGNLRHRREAQQVISGSIVDAANSDLPNNVGRLFDDAYKPAPTQLGLKADDVDPTEYGRILYDTYGDRITGWRKMLAQLRHSPIANAMLEGASPEQVFARIRGTAAGTDDALRMYTRDLVTERLSAKFDTDVLATRVLDDGTEVAGRVQSALDEGGTLESVLDDMLGEVADELGMGVDEIEALFDEFPESISERLTAELRAVVEDTPLGRTAHESGMLNALTRRGTPWKAVKNKQGERYTTLPGVRPNRRGGGQKVMRGERRRLTDVAHLAKSGSGNWVLDGHGVGELWEPRNRILRATDDEGVAIDYASGAREGEHMPPGDDYVNVIYEFDDDVRVANLSWASPDSSDILIADGQTFRVSQRSGMGPGGTLKKDKDTGEWSLRVKLETVPDTSTLGMMQQGRTPEWVYEFGQMRWNIMDDEGIEDFIERHMSRDAFEQQVRRETITELERVRQQAGDPRITGQEVDESVIMRKVDLLYEQQVAEFRQMVAEARRYFDTGQLDESSLLYGMAQAAPTRQFDNVDHIYVSADDFDFIHEMDGTLTHPREVDNVKAFNDAELRQVPVRSNSGVVRAYRNLQDVPSQGTVMPAGRGAANPASSAKGVTEVPLDWLREFVEFDRSGSVARGVSTSGTDLDSLRASMDAEGLTDPLILEVSQDGTATLIEGNHRLAIAEELGFKNVPIEVVRRTKGTPGGGTGLPPVDISGRVNRDYFPEKGYAPGNPDPKKLFPDELGEFKVEPPGSPRKSAAVIRINGRSQALTLGDGRYVIPKSDLRMGHAQPSGVSGRVMVNAEVIGQPRKAKMPRTRGGDGPLADNLRTFAQNGDVKAQQLLDDDVALMEHLRSVQARVERHTRGSQDIKDLVTGRLRERELRDPTYTRAKTPDFDDPTHDKRVDRWLSRRAYEYMPDRVKVERKAPGADSAIGPAGKWTQAVDNAYANIISKPANKYSRLPTWQQAMVRDLERQMPALANDALRDEVVRNALDNLNITSEQRMLLINARDKAKGKEGFISSLEESNELMITQATHEVERILFDVSTRSAFQEAYDAWVPFYDAWREGIEIWTRIIKNDPSVLVGAFARARGIFADTGIVHTNDNGERVFTAPFSQVMGNYVERKTQADGQFEEGLNTFLAAGAGAAAGLKFGSRMGLPGAVAGALGGAAAGYLSPDITNWGQATYDTAKEMVTGDEVGTTDIEFDQQLTGVNLILQSVGPGFGPIVQWPAGAFIPDTPNFAGLQALINPYGDPFAEAGDVTDWRNYVDTLVPAYAKKLTNAWTQGDIDPVQWNSAVHDAIRALQSGTEVDPETGELTSKYDPRSPVARQRLTEDAERAARAMLLVRGLVQGVSVTGTNGHWSVRTQGVDPAFEPNRPWDPEQDPEGVWHRINTLATAYYTYLEDTGDTAMAMARFVENYGVTPAYLATPKSRSSSRLPVTIEGETWRQENKSIYTNYPAVAGYFAPIEDAEEFDYTVWRNQFKTGDREIVTPEEQVALANQNLARQQYYNVKTLVEQSPLNSTEQRRFLTDVKGALELQYPGWQEAIPGQQSVPTAQRIQQLERAVRDPMLTDNPLTEPLNIYFNFRRAALGRLASRTGEPNASLGREEAEGYRQLLTLVGTQLAQESPEFSGVWQLLSREVEV